MNQETLIKAQNKIKEHKRLAMLKTETEKAKLRENADFSSLEKEYSHLMIENARAESYGQKVNREKEKELRKKLETFTNSIKPDFFCNKCKDEGYVNGQMCTCLKEEISNILKENSGFEHLENFAEAEKTCGELAPVYALMKKWCASDFKKNLIYIAGPTGVGKTVLASCMANELIAGGHLTQIVTAYSLNQDFKEFSRTQNEQLINKYLEIEILFIDDLGTEPQYRNVTNENFYLVLNERKLRNLPTVITSNLTMEDVRDIYGERIFSRIANRTTSINLFIDGNDRRLKK